MQKSFFLIYKSPTQKCSLAPTAATTLRPRTATRRNIITASSEIEDALTEGQITARVRKAVNLIATSEKLVVAEPDANKGLAVWKAIREIPEEHRVKLVDELSNTDIRLLWKLAGQRYTASPSQIVSSIGLDYSLWRDLPSDYTQVVYHTGKAALPLPNLLGRFSKAFFIPPNVLLPDAAAENESCYGRVIHNSVFRNRVFPGPLYLKATVGNAAIPGLQELCDMAISYVDPEDLPFTSNDIPKSSWPRPRPPPFPFNKLYTDYVRAAGPGVLVGVGFRVDDMEKGLWPLLHFVMVREKIETLIE